jgi:hypothetical protein
MNSQCPKRMAKGIGGLNAYLIKIFERRAWNVFRSIVRRPCCVYYMQIVLQ